MSEDMRLAICKYVVNQTEPFTLDELVGKVFIRFRPGSDIERLVLEEVGVACDAGVLVKDDKGRFKMKNNV